jgi:hypothetical protein
MFEAKDPDAWKSYVHREQVQEVNTITVQEKLKSHTWTRVLYNGNFLIPIFEI